MTDEIPVINQTKKVQPIEYRKKEGEHHVLVINMHPEPHALSEVHGYGLLQVLFGARRWVRWRQSPNGCSASPVSG